MKLRSPKLISGLFVTAAVVGCSIVPGTNGEVTETAEGWRTQPPSMQSPTQIAPPVAGQSPSAIPTLGPETRWSESAAEYSVLIELPSPEQGHDLYLVSPRGESPKLVIGLERTIVQPVSSPDGNWLALVAVEEGVLYGENLELLSVEGGLLTDVVRDAAILSLAWSPTGRSLGYTEILQSGVQQTSIYDLVTGETRAIFSGGPPGGWGLSGWVGEDRLLLTHFLGGGLFYDQAALLDVDTGMLDSVYEDESGQTGWIGVSPNGRLAIVVKWTSAGALYADLLLLDLSTRDLTPLAEFAVGGPTFGTIPVWSPGSEQVAFTVSDRAPDGTLSASRVLSLNVTNRVLSVIVEVAYPPMLIRSLAWVSDTVLVVNNYGADQVLYSIHSDGSAQKRMVSGRFLTTIP